MLQPIDTPTSGGANVLLVGGDESLRRAVREVVASNRHCVLVEAADVEAAARRCRRVRVAVVMFYVGDSSDHAAAREYLRLGRSKHAPVVILHEPLDAGDQLDFFRHGAVECLERPLNLTRLALVLDMLAARVIVQPARTSVDSPNGSLPAPATHFPASACMARIMDQVKLVAPLDTTVLITGETGTGKTRLSRLIHELSPRRMKHLVTVNCGALTPSLVESELFGHVRGAFTGADREHTGKLAYCADGTLLLDEIDALTLDMQVKLLRVVEERTFEAVGSERSQQLRARLIVATNRPLEQEVAEGRFRSDLYYRLSIMGFHLPPLRQRRDEIGPLVDLFIHEFSHQHGLARPAVTSEARAALESYTWPGNIRQLRNVMERAVILAAGHPIDVRVLPEPIRQLARPAPPESPAPTASGTSSRNKLATARWAAEKSQLVDALQRNGNNRSRTAADLGISRVALYKRLRKFQMM